MADLDVDDAADDDFAAGMAPQDASSSPSAPPPAPTSPLIRLLEALGLKKKAGEGPPAAAAKPPRARGRAAAPPTKVDMPPGPLLTVLTRNEFYRDGFRNMLRLAILEAAIIVGLLISFIFYMGTAESKDRYFATTADGRIMQLLPLDQANMTRSAVLSWVAQAVSEVMTFGFHDYQRRLQQSSRHFTQRGWRTFTAALNESHIIEGMSEGKQVLTAQARSAPIVLQEGVFNGKYRWIVKLPIRVTYGGQGMARTDNLVVTLVIDRVPSLENPDGVGIEQWISVQG